jgi:predicted PurR-regulated permease PerM
MTESIRPEKVLFAIAAIVIVLGGMKAASGVLVPALLALFVAIVCTEPMHWMVERGLPRALAILIVVILLLAISSTLPFVISGSYVQFTDNLPAYEVQADKVLVQATAILAGWGYELSLESLRAVFDTEEIFGWVQTLLAALGGILSRYVLIMLLVIFILVDFPRSLNETHSTAGRLIRTVQHYFAIKTFTSFLTGFCVTIWLMVLDVQYPFLWGFIAFLFNFVPNIGSVIAAAPAIVLALLFHGYIMAIVVMAGYLVINFGISNGLEPRIMGKQLGLRFVWIFVSLIAWGWILGPVGMLLAVPLTMTVRIISEGHPAQRVKSPQRIKSPQRVKSPQRIKSPPLIKLSIWLWKC